MLLSLFIQATDTYWAFTYAGSSARSQGHSDKRDLVFVIKNLQSDGEEAWEMVCPGNDGSMQKVPWEYRRIVSGPKGKPGADEHIIYK